jgi:glycosyltransferase involved in cell wall biosynthesis
MLEAMKANLPIIASDTAVNREVCGSSAVYYPPLDAKGLAQLLILICSRQSVLSNGEVEKSDGFDWSWERYVQEFIEILTNYDRF